MRGIYIAFKSLERLIIIVIISRRNIGEKRTDTARMRACMSLKGKEREEEKANERKKIRVEMREREKVCKRAREDTFAYIYT